MLTCELIIYFFPNFVNNFFELFSTFTFFTNANYFILPIFSNFKQIFDRPRFLKVGGGRAYAFIRSF